MSKGGESSSSASAQTPAQWASAQSNTSIAAWREADILGFSQAQLKALTAAQMSHITVPWAVPAAVWTADTLNAVPLQYWSKFGTRYRVTTNNGVSRITELSQRSGDSASGQFNWFDDLGYSPASGSFSFSPAVIAGISNERIAQIGTGLGHNTLSAPQLTPNAGVISASDFNAALTAATASGESVVTWTISGSETAYMFASGWANMGANFMGALTVSQLGAIAHPETALGAAQFAYLSANQLIALSQMDWSRVSAAQLNATTISAFSGLQTNILREISETTWGGLDKAHTMALNAAHIQLLSASTVARMQYLGYALTANVGAVLTVAQVQNIAANCWAQISDSGFLNALSTAALQAIPVSAFANMADAVLASLDSTHVAALTANQAANYPLSKLSDASSAFYRDPASLNFADFVASDNVNWRQAPASFIKRLTAEQLHLISPAQFATLSSSALAGLTRSQTQSLTLEQIQSLSASQLGAVTYISRRTDVAQQIFTASVLTQMNLDFWRRVDSDFLNALSITAFQAITGRQMAVIAANAFNRLDQVHINSLTGTQMLALTAAQVGQVNGAYLTLSFLRGVRLEAFKGLVPEQMRRLHDYLFNTVVSNAFSSGNTVELEAAEMQFATLVASIMDGDDGREAWLKQSVDLLIRLQWLDPAAAANLSASDVQNTYATLNWSWMSGSFLNNISTAVFSQLKASNIGQLNVGAVAILNDAHVQVLTATQVAAMSGEQLSAIANLGALQASAVQSLSASQIAGMTQNWAQINATFLSHMTARQFAALTPSQFGQLNVAQLAATAIDWRLIAPEQLNALSLTEFSRLCTGDNPAILGTTTGVLLGLGGEQMAILAQAAASYSLAQKNTLLNRLFGSFTTEQTNRLIDLMKNDDTEQIALQTGLVALLAKMDGTTTGINTAIQTLVSLRQMQPSWFNADNLSNVLSVLTTQYTNYLQQPYQAVINQSLYAYAFSAQAISELLVAKTNRLNTERVLLDNTLQRILGEFADQKWDLTNARGIADRSTVREVIEALRQRLIAEIGDDELLLQISPAARRQFNDKLTVLEYQARNFVRFEGLASYEYAAGVLPSHADRRSLGTYLKEQTKRALQTWSVELNRGMTRDLLRSKVSQATSTVLAFGNLVVMIGASISEIGRAVYASDKLSAKERDQLIASASLSAIANLAQGLQLPMTLVMQALVNRYSAQVTGSPAEYAFLSTSEAIAQRFKAGFQTAYEAALAHLRGADPEEMLIPEVPNHDHIIRQGSDLGFNLDGQLVDLGQPNEEVRDLRLVDIEPAATPRAQTPQLQFERHLQVARASPLPPADAQATIMPHLLYNDGQGNAVIIVSDVVQRDYTSRLTQFDGYQASSDFAMAGLKVSTADLEALVRRAATEGIVIKRAIIYNVASDSVDAHLLTAGEILDQYYGGVASDVADARFIMDNLDVFVYSVVTDCRAKNDGISNEALQQQVMTIVKDRLGISPEAAVSELVSTKIADISLRATQGDVEQITTFTDAFFLDRILNSEYMGGPRVEGGDGIQPNRQRAVDLALAKEVEQLVAQLDNEGEDRPWLGHDDETRSASAGLRVKGLAEKYALKFAKQTLLEDVSRGEFGDVPLKEIGVKFAAAIKRVVNASLDASGAPTLFAIDVEKLAINLAIQGYDNGIAELTTAELMRRLAVVDAEVLHGERTKPLSAIEKILKVSQWIDDLPGVLRESVRTGPEMRSYMNTFTAAVANDSGATSLIANQLVSQLHLGGYVGGYGYDQDQVRATASNTISKTLDLFYKFGLSPYTDGARTDFTPIASQIVAATLRKAFSTLLDGLITQWSAEYLADTARLFERGQIMLGLATEIDNLVENFDLKYSDLANRQLVEIAHSWAGVVTQTLMGDRYLGAGQQREMLATANYEISYAIAQEVISAHYPKIVETVVKTWAELSADQFYFPTDGIDYVAQATEKIINRNVALHGDPNNTLLLNQISSRVIQTLKEQSLLGGTRRLLGQTGNGDDIDGAAMAQPSSLLTKPGALKNGMLQHFLIDELRLQGVASALSSAQDGDFNIGDLQASVGHILNVLERMVSNTRGAQGFAARLHDFPDAMVVKDMQSMDVDAIFFAIDAAFYSGAYSASEAAKESYRLFGGAKALLTDEFLLAQVKKFESNRALAEQIFANLQDVTLQMRRLVEAELVVQDAAQTFAKLGNEKVITGDQAGELKQSIVTAKQLGDRLNSQSVLMADTFEEQLQKFNLLLREVHTATNPEVLAPVPELAVAGGRNFTPEFTRIVSQIIAGGLVHEEATIDWLSQVNMEEVLDMVKVVLETLNNRRQTADVLEIFTTAAEKNQLIEDGVLNKNFQLTADELAATVLAELRDAVEKRGWPKELRQPIDADELSAEITRRGLLYPQEVLVQGLSDFLQLPLAEADNLSLSLSVSTSRNSELFGEGAIANSPSPVGEAPQAENPLRPASPVVVEETDQANAVMRDTGIDRARNRLSTLKIAVMNFGMLGFAIFSSVVGIAAGIAGFVYAFQSTSLSWQARVLMLSMNGVRVFSSAVMLVASGAQIAANVIKGVQAASEATKIANAGFAIGNVVGITTNIAQIGLQIQATTSATDSTSRLIAGLSVLDATLQLILNVVGTIALAFGPIGIAINLLTFVIAALLPSTAAIATAVTYRESYDDLTSKGLFKEAEVMYLHWQVAAMDASPIVNWTSSIYTAEMKKAQERTMDNAWMDKSGQERLLYSLTNNTELKDNFDSLRAQMYASAAALSQPLVNLSQGLTRATMLMLSQDNLSYFEGDKLATVKLAATFNYLSNSVSRAPKLVSATVDKQLLTLTFNQNLASLNSQLPNLSAFAVKVAGVATTVSGFSLLNNTITLTLASAVSAGQVVTFSYSDTTTGDDSRAVQNLLGKDTASITDHAVVNVNNNSDTRAPLLADAVVQEQSLTLVFDEALNTKSGKIPDRRAFTVTVDGSVMDIYNMNIQDNRVLLSLERAVTSGAAVTVSYDASYGNGALQDANSNLVANLSAVSVDNTSSTATVTASRVGWLQYDNFVASTQGTGSEAASVLNGSDYTVYANEAGANAGTARLRYLSLSNAAGEFDMYSASRATENSDRIWLDASSAQGVSNFAINTHDMTVWGGQGKNSYSLSRQYANASYIVAANSWSGDSNLVSLSGASGDSNQVVNLDYLLTADNISAGLLVTQTPFKVLGSADGLDEVIGSADNQTYYATSNVANVRLTGANANVAVGESAQVSVGVNGRVLVDMDMWRGLNLSQPTTTGVIKGNYGNYSLVNFAPTDTVNDSFIGKLDLRYQIGHLPELGAFTVNAGGTNVAVTQMKISGKTVTLSLAKAVQQNQAVSVSYQDASASNDADTLQDLAGNDVGSFSGQVVSNVTADTTAPTFKVATVQGSTLIVRFSEALLQAIKPLAGDFNVDVSGTSVAVSKAAFNDSLSLRLTLASAVSAEKTVSVSYTPTSTSAVQDLAGNAAVSFSSASVVNLANVAAAPGLRSVTANGNVLTLKFDGTLRYTLNDASAFLVTVNNTPMTISSVSVVGTSVLLYLASAVTSEQSVEVSYTAPQQVSDTTTLRDWLGNGVGNLSAQLAENITGQDLTAPTLQYAIVNGSSLVLTFSEALNSQAGFTPLPSAFAVRVSGSAVSVTQAVVSGSTVTLSLATAVDYGAAVSLSYTDLSASNDVAVVQDLAGNDAASFSNINVLNNTPDSTAPTLLSATVTGNQLTLLFSETLNSNSGYLPALTNMTVNAAGVAVGIVSGSLNGSTATLTLSNAVNADDYVTFNYSAPNNASNTQAFQDLSGNGLLSIANFSVSNLTGVDLTPPSFVSAEVNGNTLSLTFSEALVSTASFTPSLSAFSVYVDGTLSTISAVTLNGTQALLTLASAVNNTQKVTVSYSQPVNRPIQDGAGNFAASFSGKAASNVTVDNSAPTLSSASVAGALLTLTLSENLATDTTLIPSAKQFTVNVDGAVVDVLSAVVAGKVVTVTLNKAVTATQVVSVDYTPATTGTNQLQDASGNATVHFSKTVSNWSGLASIQNATVNGTQLTLTFNQELYAMSGHLPPVSAFAVQVAGVNSTVSQLAVNGYTLTLTLDTAVNYGQEVTVNYTDPSTANDVAALQNLTGMDVQTFSEAYAVHNLTPQVTDLLAPSLNSAVANASTVTLTFSEALDAGAGEWLVNYLPDGQYDAQGNPVVTSRLQASGFVNVLGSNSNDSFIIGDQSGLAASRQLNYIQLGNGQGVQVSHYDTSGNLLLAMGSTGQADVVLESGSSLQKLLTTKLVQSEADVVKYKANRDTVTLKSLSSLTALLAGYEVIDATESSSSLTAQIGEGDHQIKLGGQTVNLQFDKAVSTTSITTHQIPNSWLDYQYFNFNGINADGLWVGRESDGTVLFQARWTNATSGNTDNLNVSYDGTLSNVVMEVGHVLASATSSQLRLDKLIEVMSSPAFSTDPTAASKAIAVSDTSNDGAQTKLYRVTDIVAYSAQPQSSVTS